MAEDLEPENPLALSGDAPFLISLGTGTHYPVLGIQLCLKNQDTGDLTNPIELVGPSSAPADSSKVGSPTLIEIVEGLSFFLCIRVDIGVCQNPPCPPPPPTLVGNIEYEIQFVTED